MENAETGVFPRSRELPEFDLSIGNRCYRFVYGLRNITSHVEEKGRARVSRTARVLVCWCLLSLLGVWVGSQSCAREQALFRSWYLRQKDRKRENRERGTSQSFFQPCETYGKLALSRHNPSTVPIVYDGTTVRRSQVYLPPRRR